MKRPKPIKVTVELYPEAIACLEALCNGTADQALAALVEHVQDGMERPGSWERPWLIQAFGDGWIHSMEQDPDAEWRQRPRKRRR
jgi:hypothetical protein